MRATALLSASLVAGFLSACNLGLGGANESFAGPPGTEQQAPDGSTYFADPHKGGSSSRIHIAEMFWGRLVDVHDVDSAGALDVQPIYKNFVINENIQTDGVNYLLETNPVTQRNRLTILRTDDPANPQDEFSTLLKASFANMPPILPKNDTIATVPPFSFIPRNACLIVRFDDLLADDAQSAISLTQNVRVFTGYSPITPFSPRILFEPNFGGLVNGQFHSSRIIVDMTVSPSETVDMPVPAPVNSLGLPGSLEGVTQANVSLRIPTQTDVTIGQPSILTSLGGGSMDLNSNGPVDLTSSTVDVVRAMRAGNPTDQNNGFVLDLNAPEVVGGWSLSVDNASADPSGQIGFDFVIGVTFLSSCRAAPNSGDIIQIGAFFLEVTAPAGSPGGTGSVASVRVRLLTDTAVLTPSVLVGSGLFLSTYDPSLAGVATACWVAFTPSPAVFPSGGIDPNSQVLVRFSEPMDPASVQPFDTLLLVQGDAATATTSATTIVVGDVAGSGDLKDFTYTPTLPFAHSVGNADPFHVQLIGGSEGVNDLAGNGLAFDLPFVDFSLDSSAGTASTGGIVLRFNTQDEFTVGGAAGAVDIRGNFLYDFNENLIRPRPVNRFSFPLDRSQAIPAIMIPFAPGVQTPLSSLGSKLQTVWRYCDMGLAAVDELFYDIDIEGLYWSPIGGQVVADYFPNFEIRLAHSVQFPDEYIDPNSLLPAFPSSGLLSSLYVDNVLDDPTNDPEKDGVVVFAKGQIDPGTGIVGYVVDPTDLFTSQLTAQLTLLMPFPLNRGADPLQYSYYTWRDTTNTNKGGKNGGGIDPRIMETVGLTTNPGGIANPNNVPTFGLPLLMEYRCYPNSTSLGLNAFDISLAVNSSAQPNFRAFSTGGTNTSNSAVSKDPDLEIRPTGGYNPGSTPPGQTTPGVDNSFYIGQLDVVTRVSRVYTIFLDSQAVGTSDFLDPVLEPRSEEQPTNTSLVIEYRGVSTIAGSNAPFDADQIDAYGSPASGTITFLNGDNTWKATIDEVDGARYVQMRITFISNPATNLSPDLSAIGLAYTK